MFFCKSYNFVIYTLVMKHENGVEICSRCEDKLREADHALVSFFYWVKANHPEAHVSWSFRDQANQDQCFKAGLSKLQWPYSPHNKMDLMGSPCAEAIDLFKLNSLGRAEWPKDWFEQIANEAKTAEMPILWGGHFTHLGDLDHYQTV